MPVKKLYAVLFIVMLLGVTGCIVLLILSPEQVPVHYDLAGEVDRLGSKYEGLLWPVLILAAGVSFLLLARRERKRAEKSNEKIYLLGGVVTALVFAALGLFFIGKGMRYDPAASAGDYDALLRFTCVALGVLLAAMGGLMPKARRNSVMGLRTQWSLSSDAVWQKSQRFGGICMAITGFCMLLLALFLPGRWSLPAAMALILLSLLLCTLASRRYYLAEKGPAADESNESKKK